MSLHFLFILFYFIGAVVLPDKVVSAMLAIHSLINIVPYLKRKRKFDPLFLYSAHVIVVSIANIAMMNSVANSDIPIGYEYIVPDNINLANLIWCVGNGCIYIGYELFYNKSWPSVSYDIKPNHLQILFYVALVLTFRKLFITNAMLGAVGVVLSSVSLIGILFFARLWGKFEDKRYRNYALILFAVQTAYALLYAYLRSDIALPLLCLFIGYFVLGKDDFKAMFSYKVVPYIFMGIAFIFFFEFFGKHRAKMSEGFDRITNLEIVLVQNESEAVEEEQQKTVLDRSANLPQLTNIVKLVQTKGYYDGAAVKPLLIALVPRLLWPDKPLIGLGAWFALEIGQGYETGDWYNTSINMTIPGHAFLDFGWVGLILGCIFIGGFVVVLWNACEFYQSPFNMFGVIFGGYLMIHAFTGLGADLQCVVTFLAYYLIFFILKRVLSKSQRII